MDRACQPGDISFVVQGPIADTDLVRTRDVCGSIRSHFPGSEIILSTWAGENVGGIDFDQVVFSEDPGPLPFQQMTNRQIVSTRAGIRKAARPLVMKTRTDILFTSDSVLDYWERWTDRCDELRLTEKRVLTPHVYHRKASYLYPTAFHPSDFCFFGLRQDVALLFDIPLQSDAQCIARTSSSPLTRTHWWWSQEAYYTAPEQYIWVSALRTRFPDLAFEQFFHLTPESLRQSEVSLANNLVILDLYDQFGIFVPKYPDAGRAFRDFTLNYHEDWLELYDIYCAGADRFMPTADLNAIVGSVESAAGWSLDDPRISRLRRSGFGWEARLIEAIVAAPTLKRDASTGGDQRKPVDRLAAQLARTHLQERLVQARTAQNVAALRQAARASAGALRAPVVWHSPLFDPSGYAEEARHFLLAMDEAGYTVAARPIRWNDRKAQLKPMDETRLLAMTSRRDPTDAVHVCHTFPLQYQRFAGSRCNIGRTMFETDSLPETWVEGCNWMDRIWVPSEFNRETFARAGVEESKLAVVPGAIDVSRYDPAIPPLEIDGARGYNFLSVFDWSHRKGWDVLIRAFVEEFEPDEDVALILKVHSSIGYTVEKIAFVVGTFIENVLGRDTDQVPEIIFQGVDIPAPLMPNLYRAADCFVLPTRGEGWGRPYMEAMAMGLPVIGTNWSGNTAFMDAENSFLLDYTMVRVPDAAVREAPGFAGHSWAEPDPVQLRSLMRQVFTDRESATAVGRRGRSDIAGRFSYSVISAIIAEEIDRAALLPVAA